MKRYIFSIALAIGALTFTSCEQEEALTANPEFIEGATGENPYPNDGNGDGNNGGNGGNGNSMPADFRASTTPTTRIAVLEDFTGVRCGFCPDGHDVAKQIETTLGDEFIVIAVHASGTYSQPAPGSDWPNFETPFGAAITSLAEPAGFPAGTMNRIPAKDLGLTPQNTGKPNSLALGRGLWSSAASITTGMVSPVNIGLHAEVNDRELTVTVDVYYTDDETEPNSINVALLQNGLIGRQSGGTPDPMNYAQNHVLRALIAGNDPQWGDPITESTTKESFLRKVYTYTIPADYNGTGLDGGGAAIIEDMEVVAFISRDKTDILTADIVSL